MGLSYSMGLSCLGCLRGADLLLHMPGWRIEVLLVFVRLFQLSLVRGVGKREGAKKEREIGRTGEMRLTLPLCSVAGSFFSFGGVDGVGWIGADTGPICRLAAAFLGGEGEGWLLYPNTTVSHLSCFSSSSSMLTFPARRWWI